jgi:hypothetical protein
MRTGSFLLVALCAPALQAQESARDIVDRVDRLMRGNSSQGTVTMEIVTADWSRSLDLEIWSLGTEYALVRVLAPRKDAGTATLKAGNDIWNYLPRVDRTIKLPPSLMSSAWMGSHFTNDDLVKESRLIEDYDIAIGYRGDREGVAVWEFVLTPRPQAAVVWGRIEQRVRRDDLMPLWARYYDERGALARTITFTEFRRMGGRLVPTVMTIVPSEKPTERTVVRYTTLAFDVPLTASFFSLQRLQRGGQ